MTTKKTKKKTKKKLPTQKELEGFISLKEEISELYAELDEKMLEFLDKFGEGTFAFGDDEDGYTRVTITDNMKKLKRGETVFKNTGVKKVDVSYRDVKNLPKDATQIDS